MFDRNFVFGVVAGLVGLWAFHRWVRPMNTTKQQG